jgi:hypothetical protein
LTSQCVTASKRKFASYRRAGEKSPAPRITSVKLRKTLVKTEEEL